MKTEIIEKLKQKKTIEQYRIHEGSPVDVQWAVRWVAEDEKGESYEKDSEKQVLG